MVEERGTYTTRADIVLDPRVSGERDGRGEGAEKPILGRLLDAETRPTGCLLQLTSLGARLHEAMSFLGLKYVEVDPSGMEKPTPEKMDVLARLVALEGGPVGCSLHIQSLCDQTVELQKVIGMPTMLEEKPEPPEGKDLLDSVNIKVQTVKERVDAVFKGPVGCARDLERVSKAIVEIERVLGHVAEMEANDV